MKRILVPTDFSPMSKGALRAALELANTCGGEIHLLHVIPEYEVHSAFHIPLPERHEIEAKAVKWANKAFNNYLRGEEQGDCNLIRVVKYGKPCALICDYAAEMDVSLIVIASHGRSGFERAVFGSIAEKVIRTCDRPVMVIKRFPHN